MLKYKILYAAAIVLAAAAFLVANSAAALLLLIVMILLPIFIKLSVTKTAGKITIKCTMTEACLVGVEAKPLIIKIENSSHIPVGNLELLISFQNHMFGTEREERVKLCGIGKKMEFEVPIDTEKCGRSEVIIKEVHCCDVMDIMRSSVDFKWKKRYTVYPSLPGLRLHTQKLLAAEFGGTNYDHTRRGNDNSEVFQVREYAEGDNLSAAHWKLSAKLDDIIIREWGRPNNFRILVLLDLMKEDITGKEISMDVLSTIMGVSASISHMLIGQGIGHNVCMLNRGLQLDMSIHQDVDSDVMLDEMMSIVVPKESVNIVDEALAIGMQSKYSKLVYIGPQANTDMLKELGAYMDMTAIAVRDTGETLYSRESGYAVYTISAQELAHTTPFIEL
jgi:uncharacterized protein (DUF58 family)